MDLRFDRRCSRRSAPRGHLTDRRVRVIKAISVPSIGGSPEPETPGIATPRSVGICPGWSLSDPSRPAPQRRVCRPGKQKAPPCGGAFRDRARGGPDQADQTRQTAGRYLASTSVVATEEAATTVTPVGRALAPHCHETSLLALVPGRRPTNLPLMAVFAEPP